MELIIVGGGKVGYYLTKTLLEHGHHPHLIEMDPEKCAHMADELDIPVICGDGCTLEVLEAAGARHTDAVVAVTGRDQDNLVACQLAGQVFHVRRTVARINNPKNKDAMIQLGVETPISVTDSIARLIEREVETDAIHHLMSIAGGDASLTEVFLPDDFKYAGRSLAELEIPHDVVIVFLTRGQELIIPRGNTVLLGGDKVVCVAKNTAFHDLAKRWNLTENN